MIFRDGGAKVKGFECAFAVASLKFVVDDGIRKLAKEPLQV